MKKIYKVMQGSMTKEGWGDMWVIGAFTNLKDARYCFNHAKRDTEGIIKKPHGFLKTTIERHKNIDVEDYEDDLNNIEIVDDFKYEYKSW